MRRTILAFALGLVVGAVGALLIDSPEDLGIPSERVGEVLGEAGRGARHLQLETRVRAALALQKDFGLFGGIGVQADDATVTLTGTVASDEQRQLAELIARGVDGVDEVVNELEVHDDAG